MDSSVISSVLLGLLCREIPKDAPLVTALDDTLLKKSGKKTCGAGWRRDPLGPPFHVNFVWSQRFVQLSAAIFERTKETPARMVPLIIEHAPTPTKPKKTDPVEAWRAYELGRKNNRLTRVGVACIQRLRAAMNLTPDLAGRLLVVATDGSHTNETSLKKLPPWTIQIGRIRKDASLNYLPEDQPARGRKRKYGPGAPTPEELRQDDQIPYRRVRAFAAGKVHDFKIKTIGPLRWRKAGGDMNLQLVIIAPLGYRLTKRSKLLYRKPAYLICTDPDLPIEQLLQYYLWRWGIEVNFRDQKTILGVGQAQVRNPAAVKAVPALITASYASLLIAAKRVLGFPFASDQALPLPKWRNKKQTAMSTQNLINNLKAEMWGPALGIPNFSHFRNKTYRTRSPKNWRPDIASAILYANN